MPRINTVKKFTGQRKCQHSLQGIYGVCGQAKKVHGDEIRSHDFLQTPLRCESCSGDINIGDGYRWMAMFRSPRRTRHLDCPSWRPSELTGSAGLSAFLGAQEALEDSLGELGDVDPENYIEALRFAVEAMKDDLESAAEAYNESAENIEDGFEHETEQSMELRDNAQEIEYWSSEFDGLDFDEELKPDPADYMDDAEGFDSEMDNWRDDLQGQVEDLLGASPL